jgi:hypothetical protein
MRWQPTVMPPSAAALLNKARAGDTRQGRAFSRTQEFVAGLYWFSTLPIETRLELVRQFRTHPVAQDRRMADLTSGGRSIQTNVHSDQNTKLKARNTDERTHTL